MRAGIAIIQTASNFDRLFGSNLIQNAPTNAATAVIAAGSNVKITEFLSTLGANALAKNSI
jgi:hypothetical protein